MHDDDDDLMVLVTTAENGFKALELLGLSDDNNQSSEVRFL